MSIPPLQQAKQQSIESNQLWIFAEDGMMDRFNGKITTFSQSLSLFQH